MGNEQSTHKHNGLQTKVEEATLQHPNGGLNDHTVKILENSVVSEVAVQISCEAPTSAPSLELALDHTDDSSFPVPEENQCHAEKVQQIQETPAESEVPSPDLPMEDPKETAVKVNFFDKLFKKKTESPSIADNLQETKISTENPSSPVADDPQSDLLNRLADASILSEAETSTQSKSKHSKVEYALQPEAETPPCGSDPEPADQNTSLDFEVVDYVKVDASVTSAVANAVVVEEAAEVELNKSESTVWAVVEAVRVEIPSSGVTKVTLKEESDAATNSKGVAVDAQPETTQDSESSSIPNVPVEESVSPAEKGIFPAVERAIAGVEAIVRPAVEAKTEVEAMALKAEDRPQPEMEKRAQLCKSDSGTDQGSMQEQKLTSTPQEDTSISLLLNQLESACKQSFVKSQFKLVHIESVAQGYTICIKLEVDIQESNVKF